MMKNLKTQLTIIAVIVNSFIGFSQESKTNPLKKADAVTFSKVNTAKDSIDAVLNKYYKLNLKVFQSGSTIKDIDNIFNLFTDDFTYVHPKYGGVYTRENLYNGYKRNQEQGSYNGKIVDIKITSIMIGLNAIAVTKQFIKKEGGEIVEGKEQMAVFEFKDSKIIKIKEYW